jgi:hypothetical protein
MTTRVLLFACMALAACARQEAAQTDTPAALPAVDTVKPATDSLALRDSLGARGATTTAATKTKTTGTKTATKRDSLTLRDSVTPFDPTRKSLPPAKRP